MKKSYTIFLILFTLLILGCEDKSISKLYDKTYENKKIPCLKLSIYPKNKNMEKTLKKLYHFSDTCEYLLLVSYKADIVCNSNQNAAQKTFSNFPTGYLRMEINQNMNHLIYSYYIDLTDKVESKNLVDGFNHLKDLLKP